MPESHNLGRATEVLKLDLLDSLFEGVVVHGPDGQVIYANVAAQQMLRTSFEQMQSRRLSASDWLVLGRDGNPLAAEQWPVARVLAGAEEVRAELIGFRAKDGERAVWLSANAVARCVHGVRYVVATFVESNTPFGFRFRDVVESSRDIVLITDANPGADGHKIVYVNPAFSRLTGYSMEEVVGRSPRLLQGPDTSPQARTEIREALTDGMPVRTTILNYSKSGRPYWLDLQINPIHDAEGRVTHFAAFERDMSDSHAELERAVHAANHDPLTGALNRRGFIALCEPMQARARREGGINVLMAIDIDRFKSINDRFGHAEGDRVLKELVAVVGRRLRESDVFARIGGEEFVVLASVPGTSTGVRLAESIRQLVRESLSTGPDPEPVTVSIGVYVSDGRESLDILLRNADEQLYRAKHAGRDCVMHDA